MILLDTNIVSELMQSEPNPNVDEWMQRQALSTLFLSSITVAEIRYGIEILPNGKKKERLKNNFEALIYPLFKSRLLTLDDRATLMYASFKAESRRQGLAVEGADAFIAAIAHANKLSVATRDTSPFEAMGLKVINPFAGN